jgi:hypothetical protein
MQELCKDENYLSLIEIIIYTNRDKRSSEIYLLFKKLIDKGFINREFFNNILENGDFFEIINRYLDKSLIDCTSKNDCKTYTI